jgi:hypothetical protein
VIGSTAAIEFNSPPDNTADGFDVNVTDFSTDAVNFTLEGPNTIKNREADVSGDYATTTFNVGDGNSGDYTLTAEAVDNGSVEASQEIDILVDGTDPSVERASQNEYVQSNPQLEFTVSDDYTAVTSVSYDSFSTSVDDDSRGDVCGSGGECSVNFDVDSEDVSSGNTFTVDITAEDMVGNDVTEDFQYTLDDSYQADEPDFSVEDNEDGVVALDGDVNVDVTVSGMDDEVSDVRVKCMVDGDEVSSSDWDDSEDFSCEIPEDEVEDETVDVSVEACDRAGNCEESDEEEITFDGSDPVLESFSTVQEYKVFGDDFNVDYEAYDSATDIETVEYFFSTAVLPGEGNEAVVEDQEFKVETSLLSEDSNQHTVYMRVQDEAGRWSETRSVDFEYYPNADPSVSLSIPENFSVTAGESRGFDAVVENTGKLMIGSINVSFSSDILEEEDTVENLEGGESRNVEFVFSPNRSQIGEWPVEVSTNGPVDSVSTTVLVEANSKQRNIVDSKLENYSALLEDLNSNVSSLKQDGLNEELESSLDSGVSSFREIVQSAQEYVDEGDYYQAYSTLENVEAQYSEASQTFEDVSEKHSINERNSMIMMVLAGLALILVAGGAFVYTREDYELLEQLEAGEYELPEMGGVGETLSLKLSDLKSFLKKEEEEVEDAFQGFQ